MNELRKELGIDDWLELVKEDKNLDSAYISFAQYMNELEKENELLKILVENLYLGATLNEKQEELLDKILFGDSKHE